MKWAFALLLLPTPALAGLIHEPTMEPPLDCRLEMFPPKDRCPVEHLRVLKALEKRRRPSRIDELEDRIERLERELEELRR